jgi:predicted GNAT family acetyltransferase
VAAFRDSRIVAVAAHYWNGMLIPQVPEQAAEVARALIAASGRTVTGLLGPREQIEAAREAVGLANAPTRSVHDEELFALQLAELKVPAVLDNGEVACRAPTTEDRDTLSEWRLAYDVEALGGRDTHEARSAAASWATAQISQGTARIATQGGQLLSVSAFNAELPDAVQLGGIFTPVELRGRGYARAAIAASLIAARKRGVTRAVLFASAPNAVRCYESLGFQRVSDFGLILLA